MAVAKPDLNVCEHLPLLKVFGTGVYQTMGLVGETGPKGAGLQKGPLAQPGKVLWVKETAKLKSNQTAYCVLML